MSAEVAAAAIAGAASLLGAGANWMSVGEANEEGIQLARENRDFMYQQWKRENAYNHPSAAMRRLADAGLNPNLMYGEGAGGLPASVSMQGVDTPRVSAPQVDPLVLAQVANLNAQTRSLEHQTEREDSKNPLNLENLKETNENLRQQRINMRAEVSKMDSETELNYATISLNDARLALDKERLDETVKLWNSEIRKNDAQADLTSEEYSQMVALYELRKEGLELSNREICSRIGVNSAQAAALLKQVDLYDAQIKELDSQVSLNKELSAHEAKRVKWYETNQKLQNQFVHQQSLYWNDYRLHPSRYRSSSHSESRSYNSSGYSTSSSESN